MANLASFLKDEITRIARKHVRAETEALKKASSKHRTEIAALKRQVADLERMLAKLGKAVPKPVDAAPAAEGVSGLRFTAKGLKTKREALDLSAADMGKLIGVSGQTIYHWESGKARPRASQLPAIAAVRKLGKRDAQKRLQEPA